MWKWKTIKTIGIKSIKNQEKWYKENNGGTMKEKHNSGTRCKGLSHALPTPQSPCLKHTLGALLGALFFYSVVQRGIVTGWLLLLSIWRAQPCLWRCAARPYEVGPKWACVHSSRGFAGDGLLLHLRLHQCAQSKPQGSPEAGYKGPKR